MNIRRVATDSADLSWSMVQQGPGDPPPPPPPQPPAPPPPPPPAPPPRQVADPAAEVARLQNEIANVRAEAAAHRVNERTMGEQVTAANARITELQAEMTRREEAARAAGATEVTTWRGRAMDAELRAAALAAGIVDVDLVPLINKASIVVAADGAITGIPEAIAAFKTAKPAYFRDTAPPAPAGNNPPPSAPPRAPGAPGAPPANPSPPQSSVKDMTPDQYKAARRQAIAGLRRMG